MINSKFYHKNQFFMKIKTLKMEKSNENYYFLTIPLNKNSETIFIKPLRALLALL